MIPAMSSQAWMCICCRRHGEGGPHRVGTSHKQPEGWGGFALGQMPEVCQIEGVLVAIGLQAVSPFCLPSTPVSERHGIRSAADFLLAGTEEGQEAGNEHVFLESPREFVLKAHKHHERHPWLAF